MSERRRPRKTVNAGRSNPALKPTSDTLQVGAGVGSAKQTPAAAKEKRPPFGSYMDRDLQKEFKLACVAAGLEMQEGLEQAVRLWLDMQKRSRPAG